MNRLSWEKAHSFEYLWLYVDDIFLHRYVVNELLSVCVWFSMMVTYELDISNSNINQNRKKTCSRTWNVDLVWNFYIFIYLRWIDSKKGRWNTYKNKNEQHKSSIRFFFVCLQNCIFVSFQMISSKRCWKRMSNAKTIDCIVFRWWWCF